VPTVNPNGWYPETRHPEYALAYMRYLAGERNVPQPSQMYFGVSARQAEAVRARVEALVGRAAPRVAERDARIARNERLAA
jgi:hypothetical protein